MTATLPPDIHGSYTTEEPPDDHLPVCAIWISNLCTCHHREIRMTRPYLVAKPVELPCDADEEAV